MPVGPGVATMTVSLPKPLRGFVEERVVAGGFGSVSDYIRELIRRDRRDAERESFERKLTDSAQSLSGLGHVPPEAWAELQASISRGVHQVEATRFGEALELMKVGILLTRERLRKEYPTASAEDIELRLAQWLNEQSETKPEGPFRPASEERLRRILGSA